MNIFLLYLVLLKGTVTAFAGLASLPVIQDALVFQYHVLTDKQLNEAVVITRSTPGPVGLYIVSVLPLLHPVAQKSGKCRQPPGGTNPGG